MTDWLLIDGSSIIFRAFFGIPASIKGEDGTPVNAIRGFIDVLARLITDRQPQRLAIGTDEDWRPAFRVELIPTYKSHRVAEPVPPLLIPQIPVVFEVMEAVGIEVVKAPGFEAEDVIASLAALIAGRIEIVSGDRDLFALVRDPDVCVLYPEGMGRLRQVDEADISRRYEIPGPAYLDYAVLRGDPSDGLPGLSGIGDKKAAALVRRYGGLDQMIAAGIFSDRQIEYVERARQVVRPVADIPLQPRGEPLPHAPQDPARLEQLRQRHRLDGSVERLLRALAARQG